MKNLFLSFSLLIFSTGFSSNEVLSQSPTNPINYQTADWSVLFPEITGCERVIQPLKQNGEVLEQTAIYERENYKQNKGENYVGCGSITLRFEPSARETARENSKRVDFFPFGQTVRIKSFEAYSHSPQCGNDDWTGSISVYFDKDKLLFVSAFSGAEKILEFAQNADYELIKKSMKNLVKKRTNKTQNIRQNGNGFRERRIKSFESRL
jgi:hypothetical protein